MPDATPASIFQQPAEATGQASVAFASLYLGLVVGTLPIRVVVGGPVASVELRLDDRPAGKLAAPAWSGQIELGREIAPHELVARALDSGGVELARARQWLNLPRPPAEVEILLERNALGVATSARLAWESLTGEKPKSVRASFNGRPLAVSSERRVTIPAHDPEQVALLTVELEFENEIRARKDVVLGGRTGEQAETELTAVPIRVYGGATPTPATLRDVFESDGRPLDVAAVEDGAGILLVVRDSRPLNRLGQYAYSGNMQWFRHDLQLDSRSVVRFVWPRPAAYPGDALPVDLFPASKELDASFGGLRWDLTRVFNPSPERRLPRFADAVAVAALNASGTFLRRAVLLILEPGAEEDSQYNPAMVRRFLASLRVPLFVWSLGVPKGWQAAWTEAVDVSSEKGLRDAFQRIKVELETQRIAWVEGKVLPQRISLAAAGIGIELVR